MLLRNEISKLLVLLRQMLEELREGVGEDLLVSSKGVNGLLLHRFGSNWTGRERGRRYRFRVETSIKVKREIDLCRCDQIARIDGLVSNCK